MYRFYNLTDIIEERQSWEETFQELPSPFSQDEKAFWIRQLSRVSLSSDAFFPFRDNIDGAVRVSRL